MAKKRRISVHFDREISSFVGIDEEVTAHLNDTFKGVNVQLELNKMMIWLCSPKGRGRVGNIGFIMNWLTRAYNNLHPSIDQNATKEINPIADLMHDYLEGLWATREHILEFNTIRKI